MTTTTPRTPILIAAAALLAAAFLPLLAGAQEASPAAAPGQATAGHGRVAADLGLTPEQMKALGEFRKARLAEGRTFREEMAKLRAEMRDLAKDPQANQVKIDALIDRRAALRAGREKAALRARAERNKIFTPDQLEKLRSFRARRLERGRLGGRAFWRPVRLGHLRSGFFDGSRAGLRTTVRLRALRHRLMPRWRP